MSKKSKDNKEASGQIIGTIHPSGTLFMRHAVGEAKRGELVFEMSANFADMAPIIRLPDGRWVTFTWHQLLAAAEDLAS